MPAATQQTLPAQQTPPAMPWRIADFKVRLASRLARHEQQDIAGDVEVVLVLASDDAGTAAAIERIPEDARRDVQGELLAPQPKWRESCEAYQRYQRLQQSHNEALKAHSEAARAGDAALRRAAETLARGEDPSKHEAEARQARTDADVLQNRLDTLGPMVVQAQAEAQAALQRHVDFAWSALLEEKQRACRELEARFLRAMAPWVRQLVECEAAWHACEPSGGGPAHRQLMGLLTTL
jgi:hypothetical protein